MRRYAHLVSKPFGIWHGHTHERHESSMDSTFGHAWQLSEGPVRMVGDSDKEMSGLV